MNRSILISSLIGGIIGFLLSVVLIGVIAFYPGSYVMHGRMMGGNRFVGSSFQEIDRHFIEQMIPHHQGAIDMANIAIEKAQHQEIKELAEIIKKDQSEEIKQMKEWYRSWYGSDVPAYTISDYSMMGKGMMNSSMIGQAEIENLKNSQNFDKDFINEMIPHHRMAIMMANMVKNSANHKEIRDLANSIINSQGKEIGEMQYWYKSWF
jgi:uncharacterized protein (DUF305 family)